MLKFKKFVFIAFIITFSTCLNAKIKIKYKIGDEIITNFDILEEKKYLLFLRPNLKNLNTNEINKISEDSLIKDIIKKKEINKVFAKSTGKNFEEKILNDLYRFKKVKNKEQLIILLNQNKIEYDIIKPTINGLIEEKIDYIGFIFIGLINVNGQPKVIEYNVRMGDPETQVVLPRIKNDFMDILISCAKQNLDKIDLDLDSNYYVNVVLASGGYPKEYKKGFEITGLNNITDSLIFHAGTKINNDKLKTNGGRVLSIVSSSESMKEALNKSYLNTKKINFRGKVFRKDIGFDL